MLQKARCILADELEGTDIRVNAINPGGTQTRMRAAYPGEDAANKLKNAPLDIILCCLHLMNPRT
ncbi:hypothetical protein O9992_02755 [Vibrio lentus]|nr:hypothetical protein [Vibrio lentus]